MANQKIDATRSSNLVRLGQVRLGEQNVSYHLIRVRSRKNMTVLVTNQGDIEVRVPLKVTLRQAEQFLMQNADWVMGRRQIVHQQRLERPRLEEGTLLPYLGEKLTLSFVAESSFGIQRKGPSLLVSPPGETSAPLLSQRLEQWYRKEAHDHFLRRLDHWAERMDVFYHRLTIRGQKTVWGSCSAKRNININWKLMWMPYRVADYVVIHELSHLDHMDHSPDFWCRVALFEPDYRRLRRCLKKVEEPW